MADQQLQAAQTISTDKVNMREESSGPKHSDSGYGRKTLTDGGVQRSDEGTQAMQRDINGADCGDRQTASTSTVRQHDKTTCDNNNDTFFPVAVTTDNERDLESFSYVSGTWDANHNPWNDSDAGQLIHFTSKDEWNSGLAATREASADDGWGLGSRGSGVNDGWDAAPNNLADKMREMNNSVSHNSDIDTNTNPWDASIAWNPQTAPWNDVTNASIVLPDEGKSALQEAIQVLSSEAKPISTISTTDTQDAIQSNNVNAGKASPTSSTEAPRQRQLAEQDHSQNVSTNRRAKTVRVDMPSSTTIEPVIVVEWGKDVSVPIAEDDDTSSSLSHAEAARVPVYTPRAVPSTHCTTTGRNSSVIPPVPGTWGVPDRLVEWGKDVDVLIAEDDSTTSTSSSSSHAEVARASVYIPLASWAIPSARRTTARRNDGAIPLAPGRWGDKMPEKVVEWGKDVNFSIAEEDDDDVSGGAAERFLRDHRKRKSKKKPQPIPPVPGGWGTPEMIKTWGEDVTVAGEEQKEVRRVVKKLGPAAAPDRWDAPVETTRRTVKKLGPGAATVESDGWGTPKAVKTWGEDVIVGGVEQEEVLETARRVVKPDAATMMPDGWGEPPKTVKAWGADVEVEKVEMTKSGREEWPTEVKERAGDTKRRWGDVRVESEATVKGRWEGAPVMTKMWSVDVMVENGVDSGGGRNSSDTGGARRPSTRTDLAEQRQSQSHKPLPELKAPVKEQPATNSSGWSTSSETNSRSGSRRRRGREPAWPKREKRRGSDDEEEEEEEEEEEIPAGRWGEMFRERQEYGSGKNSSDDGVNSVQVDSGFPTRTKEWDVDGGDAVSHGNVADRGKRLSSAPGLSTNNGSQVDSRSMKQNPSTSRSLGAQSDVTPRTTRIHTNTVTAAWQQAQARTDPQGRHHQYSAPAHDTGISEGPYASPLSAPPTATFPTVDRWGMRDGSDSIRTPKNSARTEWGALTPSKSDQGWGTKQIESPVRKGSGAGSNASIWAPNDSESGWQGLNPSSVAMVKITDEYLPEDRAGYVGYKPPSSSSPSPHPNWRSFPPPSHPKAIGAVSPEMESLPSTPASAQQIARSHWGAMGHDAGRSYPYIPEVTPKDAWDNLIKADRTQDMQEFLKALDVFTKACPTETLRGIKMKLVGLGYTCRRCGRRGHWTYLCSETR